MLFFKRSDLPAAETGSRGHAGKSIEGESDLSEDGLRPFDGPSQQVIAQEGKAIKTGGWRRAPKARESPEIGASIPWIHLLSRQLRIAS